VGIADLEAIERHTLGEQVFRRAPEPAPKDLRLGEAGGTSGAGRGVAALRRLTYRTGGSADPREG
jgi:hypothetical protein